MNKGDQAFFFGMTLYEQSRRAEALPFFRMAAEEYQRLDDAEGQCRTLVMAGESLRMLNQIDEGGDLLRRAAEIAEQKLSSGDASTKANALSTYGNFLTNVGRVDEALRYLQKAVVEAELTGHPGIKSNSYLLLAEAFVRAYSLDSARRPMLLAVYYGRRLPAPRARCLPFFSYGVFLARSGKRKRAYRWLERAAYLSLELTDLQLRCNCCMELGSLSSDPRWLREAAETARQIEDAQTACNAFVAYAAVVAEAEKLEWLRRAGGRLSGVHDPHTRVVVQEALIGELFHRGLWSQVLSRSVEAVSDLLVSMRHNPFLGGVAEIARTRIVPYGVYAADQLQRTHPETQAIITSLSLLEAVRSVQIREGLRRHIEGGREAVQPAIWNAGPPEWKEAFSRDWFTEGPGRFGRETADLSNSFSETPAVRGNRMAGPNSGSAREQPARELQFQTSTQTDKLCEPQSREDIGSLFADEETLVLYFGIVADDLVILPIHREGNAVVVEGGREGLIWVRNVRSRLEALVHQQNDEIDNCKRANSSQVPGRDRLRSLYGEAFELINGQGVLDVLARRIGSISDRHVVVIPDGPLFELPMHAFVVNDHTSERFYELFRSFHYGLSFKTLDLQGQIQRSPAKAPDHSGFLRLCLFANPDMDGNRLPNILEEAQVLVKLLKEVSGAQWRLHGDTDCAEFRATVENFEKWHGLGNVLWASGHGLQWNAPEGSDDTTAEMALLLCDGGVVGPSQLLRNSYDFSGVDLFMASACLLGKIPRAAADGSMVTAFNATLALRGCRRVTSALWELADEAAGIFSEQYLTAILKHCFSDRQSRHSYSLAYTEALRNFRLYDNGRFDNDFFWAPYTHYGLG